MILKDLAHLQKFRNEFSEHKLRLVVTNGVFDILTRGHCAFLKQAQEMGDFLLVGINSDRAVKELKGEKRPVNNQEARAEVLDSLKWVDAVCIFDNVRATEFLELARPNIYVKASDYSLETLNPQEKLALEKTGAIIMFLNFLDGYSTTNTIKRLNE